jgi:SAM-dependent methyltransferase
MSDLPLPPVEFRRLVGPVDAAFFDNPSRGAVLPDIGTHAYSFVFDFGCGCGRLARQLIQQRSRPAHYIGVDRHRGMVEWCATHLGPVAPGFEFRHHDVHHEFLNPTGQRGHVPLPAPDAQVTLFIAWSVFTHLLQADAEFYLRELSRVLGPSGVAVTTWFLFDKRQFPMMQEFQNALMINDVDPTNAVIFDRAWLIDRIAANGLVVTRVVAPTIRGFQWTLHLQKQIVGRQSVEFPEDRAPIGIARPPIG